MPAFDRLSPPARDPNIGYAVAGRAKGRAELPETSAVAMAPDTERALPPAKSGCVVVGEYRDEDAAIFSLTASRFDLMGLSVGNAFQRMSLIAGEAFDEAMHHPCDCKRQGQG